MRKYLFIIGLLLAAPLAQAQQTPVTATVTAPNGPVYAFATGSANIACPGNQQPTFNGFTLARSITITGLDGFGRFSMTLYDVNLIQPVGCAWTFSITDQTGVFSFITGSIGGSAQTPAITGSSVVNLSAAISAYAVPLPNGGGGGTNILPLNNIFTGTLNTFNGVAVSDLLDTFLNGGGNVCSVPGTGELTNAGCTGGGGGSGAFAGPNPWIDTSTFGMRAVASSFSTTASCVSGSPNVVLSGGSFASFINGDGIFIEQCGATVTLSTPGPPTVTPSLASGPDLAISDVVNAPTGGATSYSYKIAARDKNGGITAAGTAGTTSTGVATLGQQQCTVTTMTRALNVVTVNCATATGAAPGAEVFLANSTDASFSGEYMVASTPTTTQMVLAPSGLDTRGGASASASGGIAQVTNCNHLVWSPVSGAWQYYIYSSGTLAGVTPPGVTSWNDYGTTLSALPPLPDFVPTSAPSVALNDYLATTIISGAPSANIVIAVNAPNSASAIPAKFDDMPNFLNAANAAVTTTKGQLRISTPAAGLSYFFNSHGVFPGVNATVMQTCNITLNETLELSEVAWHGFLGGCPASTPQFGWNPGQIVTVGTAYPGIYASVPSVFDYLSVSIPAQGLGMVQFGGGGDFNSNMNHMSFAISGTDYMGQAFIGLGMANTSFDHVLFETNDSSGYGFSFQPILMMRNDIANIGTSNDFDCNFCYFVGRGFGFSSNPTLGGESIINFNSIYSQAMRTPLIQVGKSNNPVVHIRRYENDSASTAFLANLGSNGMVATIEDSPNAATEAGGAVSMVTGNLIPGLTMNNTGNVTGQNRDNFKNRQNSQMSLPFYSSTPTTNTPAASGDWKMESPLHFPSQHTLYWDLTAPTGLACVTSAGGAVPVGSITYQVSSVGVDGGESTPSLPITCTTTSGNQTNAITWTPVTGATSYNVYRGGPARAHNGTHLIVASYTDTFSFTDGTPSPADTGTGLTTIESNQVITPQLTLTTPLNGGAVSGSTAITSSQAGSITVAGCVQTKGVFCVENFIGAATPDVAVNACITAAEAVGGDCDARALSGTVPNFVNGIQAGTTTPSFGRLLLPCQAQWQFTLTGGTQYMLSQYSDFGVVNDCPQNNMVFRNLSANGGAAGGYTTVYAPSAAGNSYWYASGFSIQQAPSSSLGYATGINCNIVAGQDNSIFSNIMCFDGSASDTDNILITVNAPSGEKPCCSTSFYNLAGQSLQTGPTVLHIHGGASGAPSGLTFFGGSFTHPKPGAYNILMDDSNGTPTTSAVFVGDVYEELSTTENTIAVNHVDNFGNVKFDTLSITAELAGTTRPAFDITSTGNPTVFIGNLKLRNGSGNWTVPLANCIINNHPSPAQDIACPAVTLGIPFSNQVENLASINAYTNINLINQASIRLFTGTTGDFSELHAQDNSGSGLGDSNNYWNPTCLSGRTCEINFFRLSNTTGPVNFNVLPGNNTAVPTHKLSGNGNSFLQANGGNLDIGSNASCGGSPKLVCFGSATQSSFDTSGNLSVGGDITSQTYTLGGAAFSATATSCTLGTPTGGTSGGQILLTGAGSPCVITVTFPKTATTGWVCDAHDQTTLTILFNQSGGSQTTAIFTSSGTTGATDKFAFKCQDY